MNIVNSIFWFNTIGAGESTLIDFERPLNTSLVFRASSNATWLKETNNFDLRQDLSLFHKLDDYTGLVYQMSAIGVSRPQTQVSEYVILMTLRNRLHRDWVYIEISPQIHYPRTLDFKTSNLLSLRLELLFDKSK